MTRQHRVRRFGLITAVAVLFVFSNSAQAFYWRGWPGSGLVTAPHLVDPNHPTPGNPPSDPLPLPGTENTYIPPGVGSPESVPEPTTGLAGLIGLGAIAALRRWRKCLA